MWLMLVVHNANNVHNQVSQEVVVHSTTLLFKSSHIINNIFYSATNDNTKCFLLMNQRELINGLISASNVTLALAHTKLPNS